MQPGRCTDGWRGRRGCDGSLDRYYRRVCRVGAVEDTGLLEQICVPLLLDLVDRAHDVLARLESPAHRDDAQISVGVMPLSSIQQEVRQTSNSDAVRDDCLDDTT